MQSKFVFVHTQNLHLFTVDRKPWKQVLVHLLKYNLSFYKLVKQTDLLTV